MAPILPRPGNVQPLGLTDRVLVPHASERSQRLCVPPLLDPETVQKVAEAAWRTLREPQSWEGGR